MSFQSTRTFRSLQSLEGQADGNAVGGALELAELDLGAGLSFGIRVTLNAGTGTLDCDVEDSMDGVTWNVLLSFAQLSGTGAAESVTPDRAPARFVRANTTAAGGGGGNWDVDVEVVGAFARGAPQT